MGSVLVHKFSESLQLWNLMLSQNVTALAHTSSAQMPRNVSSKCQAIYLIQCRCAARIEPSWQRPARFSFLENSREFFFIFTSRSRSRAVSISLSLLEKEWRDFIFHFSLLEKSESYPYFTLFSREKRVKSGAGYNLTSIFVPNCISKNCQISSKHQPQNIGQISISKSWPNPVLQVWTKHQLKKSDKN